MGTDTTPGGIGFQFRTIKQDAKRQRDAFESGKDPKDLNIGGGKGASNLFTLSISAQTFRTFEPWHLY
jgi:hypothetical protein